jgi:hypothetical protein
MRVNCVPAVRKGLVVAFRLTVYVNAANGIRYFTPEPMAPPVPMLNPRFLLKL